MGAAKLQPDRFKRQTFFDFEVKKKGNDVFIEGFSNANTVDRMKERIEPKGWKLDNYEKNPVILFDHGHDPAFGFLPVGRAVETEAQEKGLYTKAKLSRSPTEKISAVRDLVTEGILKTFSVGFDPQNDTKDGDILVITQAELIEQSIVPVPMNQDSVFSMLSKRLGRTACPRAKRWLQAWVGKIELVKKGAFTAALLHQRIADLEEMGNFDRLAALEHVAKLAEVKVRAVKDILAGEITPVPDRILGAFAEVLRINPSFLMDVDKSDVALIERARRAIPLEGRGMGAGKTKDGAATSKKGPEFECQAVMVPKSTIDEAEAAATFVEEHGYDAGTPSETDEYWVFEQAPADGFDMEKAQAFDLGDGVMATVAPVKSEESPEAAAEDEAEATDEGKADDEEDKETTDAEGDGKKDGEEAKEEDKDENAEDGKDAKAAVDTAPPPDQNPILELMKQQVSMTGSLIEEIRKLTATLTGKTEKPNESGTEDDGKGYDEEEGGGEDEDMKGLVLQIQRAHGDVKTGLKRLGV